MAKNGKPLLVGKNTSSRALGVLKPGVEALLLAAVALGCAQAGWSILAPGEAGALNASTTDTSTDDARVALAEVRSPFAPDLSDLSQSHAIDAALSVMQLSGVRMAEEANRSGAYLTMADGGQRAFIVGQEIVDGVTLADVGPSYVVVSFNGGQRQLAMNAPASYSFARAMLGLEAAPATPAPAETNIVAAEQGGAVTPVASGPIVSADAAWLQQTLQRVERVEGRDYGWRVEGQLPAALIAAGLQPDDVIVSVNGAGPGDPALLSVAAAPRVELAVDRAGQRVVVSFDLNART